MARTTERSLVEVYKLIEQNSQQRITPALIDLLRIANSSYAALVINDGSTPEQRQTFNVEPKKLRRWMFKGPEHFAEASLRRHRLVVERKGIFAIFFQLSFSALQDEVTNWHVHARVNGTELARIGARRTTTAKDEIASVSAFGHSSCVPDDRFEVWIDASADTRRLVVHEGQFGMHQIG